MTTLEPSARLENLKKSIDVYLAASLASTGLAVDWEGADSYLTGAAEWIQPRLMPGRRHFHRQVRASRRGESVYCHLSINIFVRRAGETNAARLYELRDLVAEVLYPGTAIDLKNFEEDPPETVGLIKVDQVVTDRTVPGRPGDPDQYNFTVQAYFLAEWSL